MQLIRSIGIVCALGLGAAAYAQGGANQQGAQGSANLPSKTSATSHRSAQRAQAQDQNPATLGMGSQQQGTRSQRGMQSKNEEAREQHQQSQHGLRSVTGTVESVQGNKLALKNRLGKTHEFQLSQNTKFLENGKHISRNQVAQGDEVRATFRHEHGQLHAIAVREIRPASGKSQGSRKGSSASQQGTGSGGGKQSGGQQGSQH